MQRVINIFKKPNLWLALFAVCELVGWSPFYASSTRRMPGWLMFIPAACFWGTPLVWLVYWLLLRRQAHAITSPPAHSWRFILSAFIALPHLLFLFYILFLYEVLFPGG